MDEQLINRKSHETMKPGYINHYILSDDNVITKTSFKLNESHISEQAVQKKRKNPLLFKLGIGLLIASFLPWLLIVLIPFLPLGGWFKAGGVGVMIVLAEVMFYIGAALVGKEFIEKYKDKFMPKQRGNRRGRRKK